MSGGGGELDFGHSLSGSLCSHVERLHRQPATGVSSSEVRPGKDTGLGAVHVRRM